MSYSSSAREPIDLRSIERAIALSAAAGPSLDLARHCLDRVECLIALEEDREAGRQLDELMSLLDDLEGPQADLLAIKCLARRVHFHQRDGEGIEPALQDLSQALRRIDGIPPASRETLGGELAELEVELWVHLGRLMVVSHQADCVDALERAVELARRLETPRAQVFLLRARRELATALAQAEPDLGLRELTKAEEEAAGASIPPMERDLLRSTRAEILANAGRFREALVLLGEWTGEAPDWSLAQQATVLEMADELDKAFRVGALLIERQSQRLDPRDLEATEQLVESILANIPRAPSGEERTQLAGRVLRLVEDIPNLTSRSRRALVQALEIAASVTDGEEAVELLEQRTHLLEGLVRNTESLKDRLEVTRAYLQQGDALMRVGQPGEARQVYGWAIDELHRWPSDHPFVLDVLPLAHNALGHALAASGLWWSARRELDEAVRRTASRTDPVALVEFSEVFLFRAITYINVGDPKGAVACLSKDIARMLGVVLREQGGMSSNGVVTEQLLDGLVNLCVLQAEVHVDHLDDVDRGLASYDQALHLRELVGEGSESAQASILGAKGAVLNEVGRVEEALPLLQRCLELFEQGEKDPESVGDQALARVNIAGSLSGLGRPRDALTETSLASELLKSLGDEEHGDGEEQRHQAIRAHLFLQRGEALREVGHPLLAVDEFTRSIDLCRDLLEEEGPAQHEARLRLPLALLRRARCFMDSDEHPAEATSDLREARRLYHDLVQGESRPEHRRRLSEVRALMRQLNGGSNGAKRPEE